MGSLISHISLAFPEKRLTNGFLAKSFNDWDAEKIAVKTGIQSRRVVSDSEYASDLASKACAKVIEEGNFRPSDFDLLVVISQTPDYLLPGLASQIHSGIGFPRDMRLLDINQGCSGFPYGLWLVSSLIESGEVKRALLVTADTYSRILSEQDRSTRTIFGDGASASVIEKAAGNSRGIITSKFGTDGTGIGLLLAGNGLRAPQDERIFSTTAETRSLDDASSLYMDGPAVLKFAMRVVPGLVEDLLAQAVLNLEDIDQFVFHQANGFILEMLRQTIGIPADKFPIDLEEYGNTVSTTIPTVMVHHDLLTPGQTIAVVGFGVGLSWGGVLWRT